MEKLATAKRAAILRCLIEGNSILSTSRIPGAAKNTMNYGQNPNPYAAQQQQVQQTLAQADGESDITKRMQMYNQAEQSLVNDVAWLPMYQEVTTSVRQPCVVGMVDNSQDLTPPNDWGKIYISTATPCAHPARYQ